MRKGVFRFVVWSLFLALVVANIAIFVSGMRLSEQINFYEKETKRLHQENLELEQKMYEVNSLQHAASLAAQLDFKKKAEPYYLHQIGFALKN